MIVNLLESLNALLLQHPHLLHVMRILFWVKYWALLSIFAYFVYQVYREDRQRSAANGKPLEPQPQDVFIA